MPDGERERTVATCTCCGSVYAAEKWPDGTIQPIGKRTGCDCGSETFQVLEDSNDIAPRDDNVD